MDLNCVALSGRLTAAPELKYTQNGTAVCSFSIAVGSGYGDRAKTDFFNCTAWKKSGESIGQKCGKGDAIWIRGNLEQSRWQDQNGNNRSMVKIVVREWAWTHGNPKAQGTGTGAPGHQRPAQAPRGAQQARPRQSAPPADYGDYGGGGGGGEGFSGVDTGGGYAGFYDGNGPGPDGQAESGEHYREDDQGGWDDNIPF